MKLRTQFILLVAGIIIMPFLVTAFVLLLHYSVSRGQEPLPDYARISSWVRNMVPRAVRQHDFDRAVRERPPGLDILVLDRDDVISLSTIPQLPPGTSVESAAFLAFIRANIEGFHFQIDAPRERPGDPDGDQSLVVLKMPRVHPREGFRGPQAVEIIMYTSIALLVFSALMSYLILRSLNRSILTLEGATRRVAGGDLDFELPAKGNDRIASLTRSFDSMRRALKEEYARRSRFIMGVSHDLKTPLTLIQGYVEAIADGMATDADTQKRYLDIVRDRTRALEGMIGDLIEFVKMETGEWRMTHRDVPLAEMLGEISRRFTEDALILKRGFRSSIDVPPGFTVRMDRALFVRALENLIGNAIRYSSADGVISMDARVEAGVAMLAISDTGIGIPSEDIPRVFDPFYRGTNSRREQGFGLGLTTVKTIVESHGWTIDVASEVGKGSTFTIRMGPPQAAPGGAV
jgi:signal transduction histidine kinase